MLFLYTLALCLLVGGHFLIRRRVAALEKKYSRVAQDADELLRSQPGVNRIDPYQNAKRQYRLALLADRRDRIEGRYTSWQDRSERLAKLIARMRGWKGRKLPYTFGALDVAGAFALVDYLGAGQYVNARGLVQAVSALFMR